MLGKFNQTTSEARSDT